MDHSLRYSADNPVLSGQQPVGCSYYDLNFGCECPLSPLFNDCLPAVTDQEFCQDVIIDEGSEKNVVTGQGPGWGKKVVIGWGSDLERGCWTWGGGYASGSTYLPTT